MGDVAAGCSSSSPSPLPTARNALGTAVGPGGTLYAIGGGPTIVTAAYSEAYPTSFGGILIHQGWNLIDVPYQGSGINSFSSLLASMNGTGQLGAGSVTIGATYRNGTFHLYVPGYSPDQLLTSSQGIFVFSTHLGSWHPGGSTFTTGQTIALQRGWNLVAAPFPTHGLSASTIASQIETQCGSGNCAVQEIVVQSGGSYETYLAGGRGSTFTAPATHGVWILMSAPASWTPH
jgi:hypothetical protein